MQETQLGAVHEDLPELHPHHLYDRRSAASLKHRQALDSEEGKLKAKREQLELEATIAASAARIKVLEECECENCNSDIRAHPVVS